MGIVEKILLAIAWGILKNTANRAGKELKEYIDEQVELEKNKKAADKYDKVVQNPDASREDRRKAEDELLG